jgi:general nucleoside transport system ATP-binding protein
VVTVPLAPTEDRAHDASKAEFALELRKITKRFGSIVANREVDLQVRPGEIRGIVGENGAGKSTLMAIASGLYTPDAGQIFINGNEQQFRGREEAIALGINMVHQHFMLVPNCTVAQNLVLGQRAGSAWLRMRQIEREVQEVAERYGLEVDPHARVEDLTPTQRQRAEILIALWRGRTVLILDEPTSVLAPTDIEQLFATMRRVASEGCAVIFTSHKLREVIEVCERISVMRHGDLSTTVSRGEADVHALATLMVGSALAGQADTAALLGEQEEADASPEVAAMPGTTVLRLRSVGSPSDGAAALGELDVNAGEIIGVAGVEGNGQRELAETLVGLQRPDHCRVEFEGRDVSSLDPGERAALGLAFVPEDPRSTALIPAFSVLWNLALRHYRDTSGRSRGWSVNVDALRSRAAQAIASFDIRGATEDTRTGVLSGGNQQKVVLARELGGNPRALVIVDPTVGLDVGAAQGVHAALRDHRDRGAAIVLVSTDLDEIEALSDRIAVLYRGDIVGVLRPSESDRRSIGLMMTGLSDSKSGAGARQDVA